MSQLSQQSRQNEIVRSYLKAMEDPRSLLDTDEIANLTKQLESEQDPLERTILRSKLADIETPPIEKVTEDFVAIAKEWAEAQGIRPSALLSEGAQVEDLERAGFDLDSDAGSDTTKHEKMEAKQTKRTTQSTNGERDKTQKVVRHIKRTRKPFTTPQVMKATQVSHSTAKKAIALLIEAGEVEDTGEELESGRGRNAKIYQRVDQQ